MRKGVRIRSLLLGGGFALAFGIAGIIAVNSYQSSAAPVSLAGEGSVSGQSIQAAPRETSAGPQAPPRLPESSHENKPNVIWICLDACQACNLSCYGYERPTSPNIDALAARGALFEQNFAQANYTVQSVPSFMTSRYFPGSWIVPYVVDKQIFRTPAAGERAFPDIVRNQGYETAIVYTNANLSPGAPLLQAFDLAKEAKTDPRLHYAPFSEINASVLPWLGQPHEHPFFLYIHAMDTHFPHILGPPFDKWITQDFKSDLLQPDGRLITEQPSSEIRPFTQEEKEHLRGLYDGGILLADFQIGEILKKLEELKLLESTVIVVMSDHGDALGEDGRTLEHGGAKTQDEVLRTPLILAGPGIPPGARVSGLTENVDIMPTLIDLLGIRSDAQMNGLSLVRLMRDPANVQHRNYAFAMSRPRGENDAPLLTLRDTHFKYELDLANQSESLWKLPDTVQDRRAVDDAPALAMMGNAMSANYLPLWQEFSSLPVRAIYLRFGEYLAKRITPREAVVFSKSANPTNPANSDGKWLVTRGALSSAGWQHDAPPITLSEPVPNGKYRLHILLYSNSDCQGHPASSVRIKMPGNDRYHVVTEDSRPSVSPGFIPVDLGEIDITNHRFEITIDDGAPTHWTNVREFRLIPTTADHPSGKDAAGPPAPDEEDNRREHLKALGYLK